MEPVRESSEEFDSCEGILSDEAQRQRLQSLTMGGPFPVANDLMGQTPSRGNSNPYHVQSPLTFAQFHNDQDVSLNRAFQDRFHLSNNTQTPSPVDPFSSPTLGLVNEHEAQLFHPREVSSAPPDRQISRSAFYGGSSANAESGWRPVTEDDFRLNFPHVSRAETPFPHSLMENGVGYGGQTHFTQRQQHQQGGNWLPVNHQSPLGTPDAHQQQLLNSEGAMNGSYAYQQENLNYNMLTQPAISYWPNQYPEYDMQPSELPIYDVTQQNYDMAVRGASALSRPQFPASVHDQVPVVQNTVDSTPREIPFLPPAQALLPQRRAAFPAQTEQSNPEMNGANHHSSSNKSLPQRLISYNEQERRKRSRMPNSSHEPGESSSSAYKNPTGGTAQEEARPWLNLGPANNNTASLPQGSTNPTPIFNRVYDPIYEYYGLPVDPHLRMFLLSQLRGININPGSIQNAAPQPDDNEHGPSHAWKSSDDQRP